MRSITMTAAVLTFALAACGSPEPAEEAEVVDTAPATAVATLLTAEGQETGTVTATADGENVLISLAVQNLTPGEHGVHVHTVGSCEANFDAAGSHWNPTEQTHGLEGDDGQHAGDMPNLVVAEDGTGTLEYTLGGGATFAGLLDDDGAAFIVHAGRDDQKTDPSGDSGSRIACGVFQAS